MKAELHGVWVADKPMGPTSFDVVQQIKRLLGAKKAGHTGTLDPMATGVLPVCVGDATKVAGFIAERDKEYEAELELGKATDTQDSTGKIIEQRPIGDLGRAQIEEALAGFVGEIEQVPPMYSAVKVAGQRLYDLARAGKEVRREARKVTVYAARLLSYEAPRARIFVHCGKGTYVRTLIHDLGAKLGCGAHMTALRRLRSGPFSLSQAVGPEVLASLAGPERDKIVQARLLPLAAALREMAEVKVRGPALRKVLHGMPLQAADYVPSRGEARPGQPLVVVSQEGEVLALASLKDGELRYERVLAKRTVP